MRQSSNEFGFLTNFKTRGVVSKVVTGAFLNLLRFATVARYYVTSANASKRRCQVICELRSCSRERGHANQQARVSALDCGP
ncbi:MAG: hypothetical protein DME18_12275 [Verrucomicrobia bacterium]|nr:MAG: hypothetical protein DME18_12275 [Verrucomicrobiota bacterium]